MSASARISAKVRFMVVIPPEVFWAKKKPLLERSIEPLGMPKIGKQARSFPPKKSRSPKGRSSGLASFHKRAFPCGGTVAFTFEIGLTAAGAATALHRFPFSAPA